ncbi:MAG: ferritin-like domain-containing protein [Deltaproteobacteria bacterium]|nr:ferritin-like domain-containing protein [Deltaproteobacteria bacterium]
MIVELGDLALDEGAHLLIKRALATDEQVEVRGTAPTLGVDLPAWCRARGLRINIAFRPGVYIVHRGPARWRDAERAGRVDAPSAHAEARWGLAARGALVEAGAPPLDLPLADRAEVWADEAARLYAQAAAAQWDPATAIPWDAPATHPPEVEDAIVQVMTYLIENETAALLVPTRFLARLHPHFREVMQLLAIQAADEARHIEVFTRRARLRRSELGLSTAGGQASLATLFDEPDFAIASFLLSVLGEGSFLSLLRFLREHAPDACTREVARLAAQDEARHVAFGLAHLQRHVAEDPTLRSRLASAIERRHTALAQTAGLNEEVFDALLLLAAGSWKPDALRAGHAKVVALQQDMDDGRRQRLARLGFTPEEAAALSSLHTRNFM